MKLRTGRHNKQLVYVQHGDAPADTDPMFAVCFDTESAALIVDTFNSADGQGQSGIEKKQSPIRRSYCTCPRVDIAGAPGTTAGAHHYVLGRPDPDCPFHSHEIGTPAVSAGESIQKETAQ